MLLQITFIDIINFIDNNDILFVLIFRYCDIMIGVLFKSY